MLTFSDGKCFRHICCVCLLHLQGARHPHGFPVQRVLWVRTTSESLLCWSTHGWWVPIGAPSPAQLNLSLFCFLTGILSLMGNCILLLVAYHKRSTLKPAEFFIINLAISDLGMTLSLFPLAITSSFSHRYLIFPSFLYILFLQSGETWNSFRC